MEPEPILPSPIESNVTQGAELGGTVAETAGASPHETVRGVQTPQAPLVGSQQVLTVAAQPQQQDVSVAQQQVPIDNPAIADDVDVIEKEWVDKAKKIVSTTKDDPYTQEKEVSRLQADYLMKRYGKQIKTVD